MGHTLAVGKTQRNREIIYLYETSERKKVSGQSTNLKYEERQTSSGRNRISAFGSMAHHPRPSEKASQTESARNKLSVNCQLSNGPHRSGKFVLLHKFVPAQYLSGMSKKILGVPGRRSQPLDFISSSPTEGSLPYRTNTGLWNRIPLLLRSE